MGKKADRRASRIAAAQARDAAFQQRGAEDTQLIAFLSGMPSEKREQVRQHALRTVERPMNDRVPAARAVLGALSKVELPGSAATNEGLQVAAAAGE